MLSSMCFLFAFLAALEGNCHVIPFFDFKSLQSMYPKPNHSGSWYDRNETERVEMLPGLKPGLPPAVVVNDISCPN